MDQNDILARLGKHGSVTGLARALGIPVTTVHEWKRRRRIPSWRIDAVRAALAAQQEEEKK
jgi:DNA-binding transcriptional regulator YiaG